jgi:DNA helicase-2/ATP-dependent DNA helicase PcrA
VAVRSNIMPVSNVYFLKDKMAVDREFQKRVKGKRAIDIMIRKLYGSGTAMSKDIIRPRLTPEQFEQFEEGMYCTELNDKEELVYGFVYKNGELKSECRCYKYKCPLFLKCRPIYDMRVPPRPFNHDLVSQNSDWEDEQIDVDVNEMEFFNLISSHVEREGANTDIIVNIEQDEDFNYSMDVDIYHPIDNPQKSVIEAAPETKMLVSAGPGTGKTYTLLKRIEYLIDRHDVDVENMIILSFSRAAIAEIKQRVASTLDVNEYGYNVVQSVEIRTFDSFATYLLREVDPELDLSGKDYNTRIEMAIECIENNPHVFDDIQHIIVDEIQDLVGVRARLVKTILSQAIYEYQVKDKPHEMNAEKFHEWVTNTFGSELRMFEFEHNYRQTTNLARLGQKVRKSILHEPVSIQRNSILEIINSIPDAGTTESLKKIIVNSSKTYGVLCRNNGQVLAISVQLRRDNIPHTVQRPASQRLLAEWLGKLLGEYGSKYIDYSQFADISNKLGEANDQLTQYRWTILKRLEQGQGSRIDLGKLFPELASNYVSHEQLEVASPSNVHRSKGREYDEVILLDNDITNDYRWSDVPGEVRTNYVALTRPKQSLHRIHLSPVWQRKILDRRWISTGRAKKAYVSHVEVGLEFDVEASSFADTKLHVDHETVALVQDYICNIIQLGDEVVLVRNDDTSMGFIQYRIYHEGVCIGTCPDCFLKIYSNH